MIVVDVETSGVDARTSSILSIGAVDFNNPVRQLYIECRAWDGAHIHDEALAINGYTRSQATDPAKKPEAEAVAEFKAWLEEASDHTVIGENPFFDVDFLLSAAARSKLDLSLPRRVIDLHSITYFHMIKRGLTPPTAHKRTAINSDFIMEYVGIGAEPKPHIALNGAIWEAEAFSRLLHDKPLFPQFSTEKIPWL